MERLPSRSLNLVCVRQLPQQRGTADAANVALFGSIFSYLRSVSSLQLALQIFKLVTAQYSFGVGFLTVIQAEDASVWWH